MWSNRYWHYEGLYMRYGFNSSFRDGSAAGIGYSDRRLFRICSWTSWPGLMTSLLLEDETRTRLFHRHVLQNRTRPCRQCGLVVAEDISLRPSRKHSAPSATHIDNLKYHRSTGQILLQLGLDGTQEYCVRRPVHHRPRVSLFPFPACAPG